MGFVLKRWKEKIRNLLFQAKSRGKRAADSIFQGAKRFKEGLKKKQAQIECHAAGHVWLFNRIAISQDTRIHSIMAGESLEHTIRCERCGLKRIDAQREAQWLRLQ